MFIATLFTNNQKVEKTQMPIGKWMDKQNVVYTYINIEWNITQPYKRMKIPTPSTMQMNLENIMLKEITQTQKDKYCINPLNVKYLG